MFDAGGDEERNNFDDDFIDSETNFQDQDQPSNYRLMNVTRDQQEVEGDQSMTSYHGACSDPENYVPNCLDEIEYDYNRFDSFEKRIGKYISDLKIFRSGSKESFYFAILYGTVFEKFQKKEAFEFSQDENTLVNVLGQNFFDGLKQKRLSLCLNLNLSNFQRQCQKISDLLIEEKLFLKVCKRKNKFHYLIKKGPLKKYYPKRSLGLC